MQPFDLPYVKILMFHKINKMLSFTENPDLRLGDWWDYNTYLYVCHLLVCAFSPFFNDKFHLQDDLTSTVGISTGFIIMT